MFLTVSALMISSFYEYTPQIQYFIRMKLKGDYDMIVEAREQVELSKKIGRQIASAWDNGKVNKTELEAMRVPRFMDVTSEGFYDSSPFIFDNKNITASKNVTQN